MLLAAFQKFHLWFLTSFDNFSRWPRFSELGTKIYFEVAWIPFEALFSNTRNTLTNFSVKVKRIPRSVSEYFITFINSRKSVYVDKSVDRAGHQIGAPLRIQVFDSSWYDYCLNGIA